jgi:branched-chain amino acid transport system permease protein
MRQELPNHSDQTTQQYWLPAWVMNLILTCLIAAVWPIDRLLMTYMDDYYYFILVQIALYITLATSLNLINGITGQFSLGHAAFMGIGAYTAGVALKYHVSAGTAAIPQALGALMIGGLLAGIAGVLLGIPTLRLRGDYLAIATLGFGEIVYTLIINTERIGPYEVGGNSGLHNIPAFTNFFWASALAIICVVCVWRLAHSTKGKAFLAIREDEVAAAAMGVDITFYKVAAFAIGSFFAGVAGGLFATLNKDLTPDSYRFMRSIDFVVMVVLGGSGSITGVILAAIVLTCLPPLLQELHIEQYRIILYSLLLIVMMLVRPTGLLGTRELWFKRKLRPRLQPSHAVKA